MCTVSHTHTHTHTLFALWVPYSKKIDTHTRIYNIHILHTYIYNIFNIYKKYILEVF